MKNRGYRFPLSVILFILSFPFFAQHTTINKKEEKAAPAGKHKVMLVPFEPRLYLSEIDHAINKETKLSAKEIKAKFRDGINEQLYKSLRSKHAVVDLMEDTAKTKKDLADIYQYLILEYMKVPDQAHYKPPVKEKEQQVIKNGQIVDETNTDQRFMNAKIKNATLVPYLYGKYKTDIFVFINELDIKSSGSLAPAETQSTEGFRKIVVHYTVYTYDAKEINSGIAETQFPVTVNNPNKIINTYFAKIGQLISERIDLALAPPKKN
jgi:hypothetical protein